MKKFKSREDILIENLKCESIPKEQIEKILTFVGEYEKNNLDTIEKLKREKLVESKRISGALKQSIDAHGPITKELIGSATKRVFGNLLLNDDFRKISIRDVLIGLISGILISFFSLILIF